MVSTESSLLPRSGSSSTPVVVAVLVMLGGGLGSMLTVIVYWAEPAASISPRVHSGTALGSSAQPVVDTSVTPAGRLSVTVTPVASDGPRLSTVIV